MKDKWDTGGSASMLTLSLLVRCKRAVEHQDDSQLFCDIEEAIEYYQRVVDTAKKAGEGEILTLPQTFAQDQSRATAAGVEQLCKEFLHRLPRRISMDRVRLIMEHRDLDGGFRVEYSIGVKT